jgi:hypothetical protein
LVNFGFTAEEVLDLNMEQFDLAIELLNNVYIRHHREELVRMATATQGDEKGIKTALKSYQRTGETPVGTRSEGDFLAFAGKGI